MKHLMTVVLVLVILLCLASGTSKIMLAPQEVEFFGGAGFGHTTLMIYGGAQIVAGILLALPAWRGVGSSLAGILFLVSTIIIFMAGNTGFGTFSLLPVAMSLLIYRDSRRAEPVAEQTTDP